MPEKQHNQSQKYIAAVKRGIKARRGLGTQVMVIALVAIFGVVGYALLRSSSAASFVTQQEAEAGTKSANAVEVADANASGQKAVRFTGQGGGSTETPTWQANDVVTGLNRPWDIAFFQDGSFIYSQRNGTFRRFSNGASNGISGISDVKAQGEGGLMGLAVDPQFSTNRYIYACYFAQANDIRTVRWKLNSDNSSLSEKRDLVTGIRAWPTGWHAGCRITFGPDGYLWITTGDASYAGTSQDLNGLAGKVLRVDRDGNGAPGNLGGNANSKIYSYGHRNLQGIAFFSSPKNGSPGLTAEHGPTENDEINELTKGNFGWNRTDESNDRGVMTDKGRWPDAISAIWSSGGSSTQAPSGMEIIKNPAWKGWNGAAAIAMQKTKHLKILRLDAQNRVTREERVLQDTYGRLRTVKQAPDGSLYILTDNTDGDKIVRLRPN